MIRIWCHALSCAGLVPVLALAGSAELAELADTQLSVPTDKGANAGLKVASLVAGMVAAKQKAFLAATPTPTCPRPASPVRSGAKSDAAETPPARGRSARALGARVS